jgi:lysozyme
MTVFEKLREMSGGKLTQRQVDATNTLIKLNEQAVKEMLNYEESGLKQIGQKGLNLIKEFEGLRLEAYDDGVGIQTIGYGTIKYPNGLRVKRGDKITLSQAEEYLKNDLKWAVETVNKVIKVPINQNQFDAMVSLVYNIGATAFTSSTLARKLNQKDYKGASEQFLVWNKAGGKVMNGLVRRRQAEKKLFDTP